MKNALILHGTDFGKQMKQRFNNWFPWLKTELEAIGYRVYVPELPEAWHPDLERYWQFLKGWDYNRDSVLVGHSSGGAAVLGILGKLPAQKRVRMAISVAGFYKDEGWNCQGLFSQPYDWEKIRAQADKIKVVWSEDDPYIKDNQTSYLAHHLKVEPLIYPGCQHFNLEAGNRFRQFPELLELIKRETVSSS